MKNWKRMAAGLLLAGGLAVAAPTIAAADTMVYQGPTASGGHKYVNAQTGVTIVSHYYLGRTFETQQCPQ